MKLSMLFVALLGATALVANSENVTQEVIAEPVTHNIVVECKTAGCQSAETSFVEEEVLSPNKEVRISVVGQGVAPMNTISPAQAYALAKRAAVGDAYRLIAEKVKGVRVDGQDLIKNMMVKRSTVRTSVDAMIRDANIVETTFKEGLCEVEMEIVLSHSQFVH